MLVAILIFIALLALFVLLLGRLVIGYWPWESKLTDEEILRRNGYIE